MRATVMYGAGDVRIENVPDATIIESTDAIVRVSRASICGTDLWPYKEMRHGGPARVMGHEAIGVVEDVGADGGSVKQGDFVVMPFAYSDGTCRFCHDGLQTSCAHGGFFGSVDVPGAQAEAVRVPLADGTLFAVPGEDEALMPSLLTLADVMGTGHHAAVSVRVGPGASVAVVGDGAVGICGVIAARRLGAAQIVLLGRHADRIALAREFGATDVVGERGDEAVERVRELTNGLGAHSALACVGTEEATLTAIGSVRRAAPHGDGRSARLGELADRWLVRRVLDNRGVDRGRRLRAAPRPPPLGQRRPDGALLLRHRARASSPPLDGRAHRPGR